MCNPAVHRMRTAVVECDRSLASRRRSGTTKLRRIFTGKAAVSSSVYPSGHPPALNHDITINQAQLGIGGVERGGKGDEHVERGLKRGKRRDKSGRSLRSFGA